MAKRATKSLQACPKTKLVLSNYSQDVMAAHNTLSNGISGSGVSAIVVFGNPLSGQSFSVHRREHPAGRDPWSASGRVG